MSAWLVSLLVASAPCGSTERELGVAVGGGFDTAPPSTGDGRESGALVTAGAVYSANPCGWPAFRAEGLLTWTTLGAPFGEGVEAVQHARLRLDLLALAGPTVELVQTGGVRIGADVVAGPALRFERRSVEVLGRSAGQTSLRPRVAGAAGVWLGRGDLRATLRLLASMGRAGTNLGGALGLVFAL